MILTHLESREGETLVRLPDGSTRWVNVADMIALANSDKPARATVPKAEEEPKAPRQTRKK